MAVEGVKKEKKKNHRIRTSKRMRTNPVLCLSQFCPKGFHRPEHLTVKWFKTNSGVNEKVHGKKNSQLLFYNKESKQIKTSRWEYYAQIAFWKHQLGATVKLHNRMPLKGGEYSFIIYDIQIC